MDLGSSTELITLKPWSTGKQLPLGFSVLGQGDTVTLLQRVMALAKELKQQVTWRCWRAQPTLYDGTAAFVGDRSNKRQATSLTQLESIRNYES